MNQTDNAKNTTRQTRRHIARLERALKFHRLGLLVSVGLVITLLAIMAFGKRERFARAIIVDDQIVCLVPTEKDARTVRERLVKSARDGLPGEAFIKQKWEDAAIPSDERPVLSVNEAVEELEDEVTVQVEAAMIRVEGADVVPMASQELAEKALEALKSKYAGPEGAKVISQKFKENVSICTCSASPEEICSDIRKTAETLSKGLRRRAEYTVQPGDYPEKIAAAHDIELSELFELNPGLRGRTVHPDEKLTVNRAVPPITVITVVEVTREKEITPPVERKESRALAKGEERVASAGEPGKKQLQLRLTLHNDTKVNQETISEQVIQEPTPKRILVGTGDSDALTLRP